MEIISVVGNAKGRMDFAIHQVVPPQPALFLDFSMFLRVLREKIVW
jgi:hypothetical protein